MENELRTFIAKRIKLLRKSANLTQERLSEKADLEPKYINKLENLNNNVQIDTLSKIISALDITLEEFFDFRFESNDKNTQILLTTLEELPSDRREQIIRNINELLLSFYI